jgi:hypothetical protein
MEGMSTMNRGTSCTLNGASAVRSPNTHTYVPPFYASTLPPFLPNATTPHSGANAATADGGLTDGRSAAGGVPAAAAGVCGGYASLILSVLATHNSKIAKYEHYEF